MLPSRANVAVAQDPAGNLKPAKDKSTERIDGIVAAIMAIGSRPGRPGRAAGGHSALWTGIVGPRYAPELPSTSRL